MSAKDKELIEEILDGAEGLDESTRVAFVNNACKGDATMAAEVYSLLNAGDESSLKELLDDGLPKMMRSVVHREVTAAGNDESQILKLEKAEEERLWVGAFVGEEVNGKGRYQIRELRRFGLMASLFFARDRKLDLDVVIKIPRMSAYLESADDDTVARDAKANIRNNFRREFDALRKLESCGFVVHVRDFGQLTDGRPFMVLEFIAGKNTLELLRSNTATTRRVQTGLAFADVANIVRQAGKGLQAAHDLQILHRDMKAENIMISDDGHVRLIDFNAADVKLPISPMSTVFRDQTWGTLGYTSPEQLNNMLNADDDLIELTPASDIYSLTVTAYQLLTGRLPFSRNLASFIREQKDCLFTSASKFRPGLEEGVDALIRQGLDFDPSKRPQSAKKFGEQLARALEKLSDESTRPLPPPPSPHKFPVKYAVPITLILIVAAVSVWLWLSKQPGPGGASNAPVSTMSPSTSEPVRRVSENDPRTPASGPAQSFSFWLDWTRTDDKHRPVGGPIKASGQEIFTNGDFFVLNLNAAQDGYLYLLNEGRNYKDLTTFYYERKFRIKKNQKVSTDQLVFDNKDGVEQFWFLFAKEPLTLLEAYGAPREIPEERTIELREFLNRNVPTDSSARENISTATTEVSGSGETVAYRLPLRHRKRSSEEKSQ